MLNLRKKLELPKTSFPLLAIILIVVVAGGYWLYSQQSENSKAPEGWVEYKSKEYGFRFEYPKDWGKVDVKTEKLDKGIIYTIDFSTEPPNSSRGAVISLESDDLTRKPVCVSENKCYTRPTITEDYINNQLKNNQPSFFTKDEASYTIISVQPKLNMIDIYKTVELPKIKVSAAHLNYFVRDADPKCPTNKIEGGTKKCVTMDEYNSAVKVLERLGSYKE